MDALLVVQNRDVNGTLFSRVPKKFPVPGKKISGSGEFLEIAKSRGVRLAKNDFGSVFGSVCLKNAVFGSVSILPN